MAGNMDRASHFILFTKYCFHDEVSADRMGWKNSMHREKVGNAYSVLIEIACKEELTMRGPVCRWQDNTKMDLNENGRTFVDEINRARY